MLHNDSLHLYRTIVSCVLLNYLFVFPRDRIARELRGRYAKQRLGLTIWKFTTSFISQQTDLFSTLVRRSINSLLPMFGIASRYDIVIRKAQIGRASCRERV